MARVVNKPDDRPSEQRGSRPRWIRLGKSDNVAVALWALAKDDTLMVGQERVAIRTAIAVGHKFALAAIPAGGAVRKYDEVIGIATADIELGDHVHVHNVVSARLAGPGTKR